MLSYHAKGYPLQPPPYLIEGWTCASLLTPIWEHKPPSRAHCCNASCLDLHCCSFEQKEMNPELGTWHYRDLRAPESSLIGCAWMKEFLSWNVSRRGQEFRQSSSLALPGQFCGCRDFCGSHVGSSKYKQIRRRPSYPHRQGPANVQFCGLGSQLVFLRRPSAARPIPWFRRLALSKSAQNIAMLWRSGTCLSHSPV